MICYSYVLVSTVECFDSVLRFDQLILNSLNLALDRCEAQLVAEKIGGLLKSRIDQSPGLN